MDVCDELDIEMLWSVGGGKIQSSSIRVSDAGMDPSPTDDADPQPTLVQVIQSGDIPKTGEY